MYTYPILDPITLQPNPSGQRYRVTDSGAVYEAWADYICNLSADHTSLTKGSTATITASFQNYDGSACQTYPASVTFVVGGTSTSVNVVGGQASTTVTSSVAGNVLISCSAANVKGNTITVVFS